MVSENAQKRASEQGRSASENAKGILKLEHGAYRASDVARFSSYQLPFPAAPPATDKHPGRFTDIDPDFH